MENFYAMPMHLFFNHGSELDETMWAGAYHKYDQRRLRRACAFVRSPGSRCRFDEAEKNLDIDLRSPTNKLCKINLIRVLAHQLYTISVSSGSSHVRTDAQIKM